MNTKFPSFVRRISDVATVLVVVVLAWVLGRLMPTDRFLDYVSVLLVLVAIALNIAGAYLILWACHKLPPDAMALRDMPQTSNLAVIGVVLWWLFLVVVGIVAILALFISWSSQLIVGLLHLVQQLPGMSWLPINHHISQLTAGRSGLTALIIVLVVTEFVWRHPAWIQDARYYTAQHLPTHRNHTGNSGGGEEVEHQAPPQFHNGQVSTHTPYMERTSRLGSNG